MPVKNQVLSFNALKFVASFFVVCIHVLFYGRDCIVPIIKTAVPCFFMISGFFLYDINQESFPTTRIKTQIVKISKILLFANILYFVWHYYLGIRYEIFKFDFWLNVLRGSAFGPHLWYLMAYVQVLFLLWLFPTVGNKKILSFTIIIAGLLCNLIFGRYSQFFSTPQIDNCFFTSAFPFFLLGSKINKYQKYISRYSGKFLVLTLLLILLFSYCEYYAQLFFPEQCFGDINIFVIALSIINMVLCVKYQDCHNACIKWIAKQGSLHSANIYIFHWIFLYYTTNPLLIFLGSYTISLCILFLHKLSSKPQYA